MNGTTGTTGPTIHGWTYHEHKITGPATLTLSGTGRIDEVRLYPVGAQMTTYSYNPGVGIITICDPSNKAVHYEYDDLHRLSVIRDADSNIVKQIKYNYSQSVNSGQVFYNTEKNGFLYSKSCGVGYDSLGYTYKVSAGSYSSLISQGAADSMAIREVQDMAQIYADVYGKCKAKTQTCPDCPLPQRRCINGLCTPGVKVYTSSVVNPTTGKYDCTYHYEFSDGFKSIDITEESDAPCM
jgi:YD repeat-containing protein